MRAPRGSRARGRRGWTRIEALVGTGVVLMVSIRAALVTSTASGLAMDEASALHDREQATRVIDRIALAVMSADRATLLPGVQDVHTSLLRYSCNLGLEDGAVTWSAPEEIALRDRTQVEWRANPGASAERCATWTDLAAPLLEGERVNGIDDNGNGLIDEEGLSFVVEGRRVTIRLTLRRTGRHGEPAHATVERVVTCRN